MQTILALILILILGYAGAHLLFYKSRFPLGTRYIMSAGSEYLFLGLLLGAAPFAIFGPQVMQLLSPAVNLGLGWIGLIFGIQFEWKQLQRMPLRFMGITLIQAIVTLGLVWAGISFLADILNLSLTKGDSLLLAAIAAISAPTCLVFMQAHVSFPQSIQRLVHYISSLDSVVGLAVFGLIHPGRLDLGWLRILLYLFLVACLILVFHLLTRFRISRRELLILTIGLVIFSSGLAGIFGLSALLLNFLLGMGLINLPSLNHRTLVEILHGEEKPIYIIFLVLAGAMWNPLSTPLLIVAVYLGLRFLGKLLGSQLAVRACRPDFVPPAFWGLALTPQGGMGIAMAVDCLQYHPGDMGGTILNIILAATLITQLLGPSAVRWGITRRVAA
jgi:hypothetical protein